MGFLSSASTAAAALASRCLSASLTAFGAAAAVVAWAVCADARAACAADAADLTAAAEAGAAVAVGMLDAGPESFRGGARAGGTGAVPESDDSGLLVSATKLSSLLAVRL